MSDINEKVILTATVEGAVAEVERSEKPQFMTESEYDLNTMFGTCSMVAQFAKVLSTMKQTPEEIIDKMAKLSKSLL